jgi:hypothetical protein
LIKLACSAYAVSINSYVINSNLKNKCCVWCCQNTAMPAPQAPNQSATQAHNPLHGVTLEAMVTALVACYGWPGLGERVPVRCFTHDPSMASSLKFLRKTPWARDKVEGLYLFMLREQRRRGS